MMLFSDANGLPLGCVWQTYDGNVNPSAVSLSVFGLQPAQSYKFRLIAVNLVGEGQPSEPSGVVRLPEQRVF